VGVALAAAAPTADAVESEEEATADAEAGPADACVVRDAVVRDAEVGVAELVAGVAFVAGEGVSVAPAGGSAEADTLAGFADTTAATSLALVVCAAGLPIDEMDWAAGAEAACITRKPSATAAVVTVLMRGEIRETGISRTPPINRSA
jgi:hypothetical protein